MYDVIIIGAGPAGLMAGIQACKNNKVLVIDKNKGPGKKLLLTGGGRCNVTNLKDVNRFLNEIEYNKKFLYSVLNKFSPYDIYDFFVKNGVDLKEEEDNKIFPLSDKANDILNALIKNLNNVDFKYNEEVLNITVSSIKEVITSKGKYQTKNIIIATGGASYKHTGSTGDHMRFAKSINQPTIPLFPCETRIILKEKPDLAGTTISDVKIIYEHRETAGNLMFTHRGLGGSSIMKMSEHIYKSASKELYIDLFPNIDIYEIINNYDRDKEMFTFLNIYFSRKLCLYLINKIGSNKRIKQYNEKELRNICYLLKKLPFIIDKVENIEVAYVTGGGIDMNYIDSSSMESKINQGVYFVGETLDIHGPIGGYNITLALSTGYLAGNKVGE